MICLTKNGYNSTFYINKFYTSKDPTNKRKNLYIDIRYGEINFTFNENKIIMDIKVHIAGNFNLPAGSITTDVVMPGQTINSISLFKQNETIPGGFQYGFPDASNVYTTRIILDKNEDSFLSNNENSLFKINLFFNINTTQLDGMSENIIKSSDLNQFISDIKNINLSFNLNLYQKNIFEFLPRKIINVNQIKKIWISSDVNNLDGTKSEGSQENNYLKFSIILNNYSNQSSSFNTIYQIKKVDNNDIKIETKSFKLYYWIQNDTYETDELLINDNQVLTGNMFSFLLNKYELKYDSKLKAYNFTKGNNGIFINENIYGYYLVKFIITINGSSRTYIIKNYFNFIKNKKILFSYIQNNDSNCLINKTDNYYEIEE